MDNIRRKYRKNFFQLEIINRIEYPVQVEDVATGGNLEIAENFLPGRRQTVGRQRKNYMPRCPQCLSQVKKITFCAFSDITIIVYFQYFHAMQFISQRPSTIHYGYFTPVFMADFMRFLKLSRLSLSNAH